MCWPQGDEVVIEPAHLEELSVNPDAETDPYYAGFQIDAVYDNPPFSTPWGQSVRVRTTITGGGTVHFYEGASEVEEEWEDEQAAQDAG